MRGASWEGGEQARSEESKLGGREASLEQGEQAGSEGSEPNVILGFRVPTTSGRKKFDDHI